MPAWSIFPSGQTAWLIKWLSDVSWSWDGFYLPSVNPVTGTSTHVGQSYYYPQSRLARVEEDVEGDEEAHRRKSRRLNFDQDHQHPLIESDRPFARLMSDGWMDGWMNGWGGSGI